MRTNKLALLIHGPEAEQWLEKISESVEQFKYQFDKIVVACYANEEASYKKTIHTFFAGAEIVVVKDLLNPGFFNINRQVYTVNEALKHIPDDYIVFKLRVDQCVDFNKVLERVVDDKILTTNCYTRSDRLYHPSDMFIAGKSFLLKKMYSMPLQRQTDFTMRLENVWQCMENHLTAIPYSPESILCRYYITQNGWKVLETQEDSFAALKRFYELANSWNIDFRWRKDRLYLFNTGSIVLPHYFDMRPFPDAPIESCRCYSEANFYGKNKTLVDIHFEFLSYLDSKLLQYSKSARGILLSIKKNVLKKKRLKKILVGVARKMRIYDKLKKIWVQF